MHQPLTVAFWGGDIFWFCWLLLLLLLMLSLALRCPSFRRSRVRVCIVRSSPEAVLTSPTTCCIAGCGVLTEQAAKCVTGKNYLALYLHAHIKTNNLQCCLAHFDYMDYVTCHCQSRVSKWRGLIHISALLTYSKNPVSAIYKGVFWEMVKTLSSVAVNCTKPTRDNSQTYYCNITFCEKTFKFHIF